MTWAGDGPVFGLIQVPPLHDWSILGYALIGLLCGLVAIVVTRSVYAVEALFERLPIHWMWWPMLGGLSVGLVGMVEPRTLGMGYENISGLLSMHVAGSAVVGLLIWKWLSWSVALGSGTSGGTLAPLFTLGGAFGALTGTVLVRLWPAAGCDVQLAALVGMAAVFAGASRALLTSVVFAFETTHCTTGILPLLVGCAGAYLVASWHSSTSIMTDVESQNSDVF